MSENVATMTDAEFVEQVQGSQDNYIIDFWATWCEPCKMLAPIVEDIAKEYTGKVKFAKINIDEDSATASQYGITAIPTLLFFSQGELVERISGAVTRQVLRESIDKTFATASQ